MVAKIKAPVIGPFGKCTQLDLLVYEQDFKVRE